MSNKKFWISIITIASIFFVCFLTLAIVLAVNDFSALPIDTSIANWAYKVRGEKNGFCYWFFRIVTEFGYLYFGVILSIFLAIIWKFKSKLWFFGGTLGFSFVLQKIIKFFANRQRPNSEFWWMEETSSSFPSGHSITATCIFALIIYFTLTSPKLKLWCKYLITIVSSIIILLVPLSRIILGVHYFTDVLGGMFWGAFSAMLGIIAYNLFIIFYDKKFKSKKQS